jgi:hypothetical protein
MPAAGRTKRVTATAIDGMHAVEASSPDAGIVSTNGERTERKGVPYTKRIRGLPVERTKHPAAAANTKEVNHDRLSERSP